MQNAEPVARPALGAPRYRITARGYALLGLIAGCAMGLGLAAGAGHVPFAAAEAAPQRGGPGSADAVLQLANRRVATAERERDAARAQLRAASEVVRQLADANALALHEAGAMPALKSPAYREPFAKVVAALQEGKLIASRAPAVAAARSEASQPAVKEIIE